MYIFVLSFLFTFFFVFFGIVHIVNLRTSLKNQVIVVEPGQAQIDAAHKAVVSKYSDPNFRVVREEIPLYSREEIGQSWV